MSLPIPDLSFICMLLHCAASDILRADQTLAAIREPQDENINRKEARPEIVTIHEVREIQLPEQYFQQK